VEIIILHFKKAFLKANALYWCNNKFVENLIFAINFLEITLLFYCNGNKKN
jgi:hypothetical protein